MQTGGSVLIGGFIVGGTQPLSVIVRAIGPSLAQANPPVPGSLPDPTLDLRDAQGTLILSNNDWQDTQRDQINATNLAPKDSKESAIIATLSPGNYTAIVSGVNDQTGVGLIEVYNLY